MIVVDTSTWVDHLRGRSTALEGLLGHGRVALHPFVLGELLLHGLPASGPYREMFRELAPAPLAATGDVAAYIGWAALKGTGVGYVDAHLLVSARMIPDGRILTEDPKLHGQAERLGLAYAP